MREGSLLTVIALNEEKRKGEAVEWEGRGSMMMIVVVVEHERDNKR